MDLEPTARERLRTVLAFQQWSIRSQLAVSWCALLALLLAAFLWTAYRGNIGTLRQAAGARANVAAQQLSQMVGRSAQTRVAQLRVVAQEDAIHAALRTPESPSLEAARQSLLSLASAVPYEIALWNTAGRELLRVSGPPPAAGATTVMFPRDEAPTTVGVNALHAGRDLVFSQTTVPVMAAAGEGTGETRVGYLVARALVANRSGALARTSGDVIGRLVGGEATFAIGNVRGDVWTDLGDRVPAPSVDLSREGVSVFRSAEGEGYIGALAPVRDTPWAVWVQFPEAAITAPARGLLRGGILVALGCLVIGAGLVITMTRRITHPLAALTHAAHDIAAGDYTRRVALRRPREIGELADSFNIMTARVEETHRGLQRANDQTQFALAAANMGVWEIDFSSGHIGWSAAMAAVFGLTVETAPKHLDGVLACVHPDDRDRVRNTVTRGEAYVIEYRILWPDQTVHWVQSRARRRAGDDTDPGLVGVSSDITERKALEEAMFAEQERTEVTLHSIGDAVISTDEAGRVTYLNAAAERLTGWSAALARGRALLDVFRIVEAGTGVPADDPGALAMRLGKAVGLSATCVLIRADQSEVPVEDSAAPIHAKDGRVIGAVVVFRDASVERAWSMKMAHLAQYDPLTDLPNRTLLDDRINHAIAAARRHHTPVAVLFVDLDRFKHINDDLGHSRGDAVLQSVAARLLASVRSSDTVSRHGGDEFVVVLTDLEHAEDAGRGAERIIAAIAEPHSIADHVLYLNASVGISIFPDDGNDAAALIGAADAAMYHAKQTERGSWQFFTSRMNARWATRRSLEGSLRDAVRRNEFVLHFQPKVDLETTEITGVEALVRWQHPTLGLLPPGEFVPVAEECGLILPIGRWVLAEACRQARAWQAEGLRPIPIAVNVSALEFRAKNFLANVASALSEAQLDPHFVELEVTESVLMTHADSTTTVLPALKDLGVQLAIDDFGTGYSSLSYLSRFPVDTLKIDRSFVQGIGRTGHDDTIINAVIGLARNLHQGVVAEGIETVQQLQLLRAYRCGEGQGYYFSRPVPAAQLAALLRSGPLKRLVRGNPEDENHTPAP